MITRGLAVYTPPLLVHFFTPSYGPPHLFYLYAYLWDVDA